MFVSRPVVVMQLPECLNSESSRELLQEVEPLLEVHRPRVVFDCSLVRSMDGAGGETLLHCLEEAMKRDGDVKLCALSPEAAVMLELMRADRVFEVAETSEESVRSFNAIPADAVPEAAPWYAAVLGEMGTLKQAS